MRKIVLTILSLLCIGAFSQEVPKIKIGGSLNLQHTISSWKKEQIERGGDFGFECFRIKANGSYKKVFFNSEYRLYSPSSGGGMLKYGWIGYEINDKNNIHIGLTQVPFGLHPQTSNGWLFNINYYVGLEDDYDMGIKWIYNNDSWQSQVAFFKNAEELKFGNASEISPNRYSYDIAGENKEVNQINLRFQYYLDKKKQHQIGISGQYGGLYNVVNHKWGYHNAFAIHYSGTYKNINLKIQVTKATNKPSNNKFKTVEMAAFGAPYSVANNFMTYTVGISKTFPMNWGAISSIVLYNDFGYMNKKENDFENSIQNSTGCMIVTGKVYTYLDYVQGYNHSWIGGNFIDDFGKGNPNAKWESRLNINIGYYF